MLTLGYLQNSSLFSWRVNNNISNKRIKHINNISDKRIKIQTVKDKGLWAKLGFNGIMTRLCHILNDYDNKTIL